MKNLWVLIGLLAMVVGSARGQTSSDAEQAFRNSLLKRQVVLRNYSRDLPVHARWANGMINFDKPQIRMLAVITVNSVKISDSQVIIEGNRSALVRDKIGKLKLNPPSDSVQIIVDIPHADMDTVLRTLKDNLFFATLDVAIANVPEKLQVRIPPQQGVNWRNKSLPKCDCAATGTDACQNHVADLGLSPPKLVTSVDPQLKDAARKPYGNSTVQSAISLDNTGKIVDLWVITSAGYEMDEAATQAIEQYKFKPASCHNSPAPTTFFIDTSF